MALMIAPEDERRGVSWRWILLAAVLALPVLAIGLVAALFDPEDYKPQIIAAAKQATGRDLVIDGKLHFTLSLRPTIAAEQVRFANAPGGARADMLRLDRIEARIALIPLLQHQLEIDSLTLLRPDVLLETDAQGRGNWRFGEAATTPSTTPLAPTRIPQGTAPRGNFLIRSLLIKDGTLIWRDGRNATTTTVALPRAEIEMDSPIAPISLKVDAVWNAKKINISGQVGSLNGLQGQSAAPWPVRLALVSGDAKLNVSGTIAAPAQGKGYQLKLEGAAPSLAGLAAFAPAMGAANVRADLRDIRVAAEIADRGAPLPQLTGLSLHAGPSDLAALVPGLKLTRLEIGAAHPDQPLRITAEGNLDGSAMALLASIGTPSALMAGGNTPIPLDMALSAGGARITLKGHVAQPGIWSGADLALRANIPDLAALGRFAGLQLPALKDAALQTRLLSPRGGLLRGVVLKDFQLTQAAIDLAGEFSLNTAPRVAIQATITSRRVDADALGAALNFAAPAPAPPAATAARAARRVIPDDPLPFALLRLADGDVRWRIEELIRGGEPTRNLSFRLALAAGKLRLDPFTADLPAGRLTGTVNIDAAQARPAVALTLRAPGLEIEKLYHALGRAGDASGTVEIDLDLRGNGASAQAIAGTASGHLGLAVASGSIDNRMLNLGLLGDMLRGINQGDVLARQGTTQLRCFALRLDAANGAGEVRALLLDASTLYLEGSGNLHLGEESLALRLRAQPRMLGLGLTIPLRVGGSFAAPRPSPDLAGSAANAIGLGAAAPPLTAQDSCATQLAIARGGRPGATANPATATPAATIPPPPPPPARTRTNPLQRLLPR